MAVLCLLFVKKKEKRKVSIKSSTDQGIPAAVDESGFLCPQAHPLSGASSDGSSHLQTPLQEVATAGFWEFPSTSAGWVQKPAGQLGQQV